MDPIPGTPVGMTEHPPLLFAASSDSDELSEDDENVPKMGPLLPQEALLSTAPNSLSTSEAAWLPPSPKRRARAAFMEKAKQDRMPLKVSMLQEGAPIRKEGLDPMMPAKKRPILPERVPSAELLRRLEPGVPVKKRITPWLTAEPARLLPAAPR